jgi:hypothetical protein
MDNGDGQRTTSELDRLLKPVLAEYEFSGEVTGIEPGPAAIDMSVL